MQGYNVILIYNTGADKILMCKRRHEPFKNLLNLVGGKIEPEEHGLTAAYREMFEETGIISDDIHLYHLMDFTYYCSDCYLEVYVGKLKRDVPVSGVENELFWIDSSKNFYDTEIFAGYGNIGHIIGETLTWKTKVLQD